VIHVCEHHDALLALWRRQDARGLRLAHVDFHDDLRGLLLDRRRGRALALGMLADRTAPVDPGNFLAHAVLEGRVDAVRWVHGLPGGRAWDLGIVRYESDWLAWPRRVRRRVGGGAERPLEFEELLLDRWDGPRPGERLSVDWDCFASRVLSLEGVERRVAGFVERLGSTIPEDTCLAYSPDYCHPTLDRFVELVESLAGRYAQEVEWLSPGLREGRLRPAGIGAGIEPGPVERVVLALRRRGIYF